MPAGRPAKPAKLKILQGNPGKRALPPGAPGPDPTPPKCPSWLDSEAKRKWKALADDLSRRGILTIVDGDALAVYCEAWSSFRRSCETLKKEGETFTTDKGYVGPRPEVAIRNAARQTIKSYAALFGLDPSSRSRLHVPPPQEEDEFEEFLKQQGILG